MNDNFAEILNECLERMGQGSSLESCLTEYGAYAEALRPLLQLAQNVQTHPKPRPTPPSVADGRSRMLAAIPTPPPAAPVSKFSFARYARQIINRIKEQNDMKLIARLVVMTLVLGLLFAGWGAAASSADALPGDLLYPVKTAVETLRLQTADPASRAQLEQDIEAIRRAEVRQLLQEGRVMTVHFEGKLSAFGEENWEISELLVWLNEQTNIEGEPVVGAAVAVQAQTQTNGTLLAHRLLIKTDPVAVEATTPTPTPVNCSPTNCTPTPECNVITCTTTTPEPTATVGCSPVNCIPTPTPACNNGVCPTDTPEPTATIGCSPNNCTPTATPECNVMTCTTTTPEPTATVGCSPANCTPTPTPECNNGGCMTVTPEATATTCNPAVCFTPPAPTDTPAPTSTPMECNPANCTPTPTPNNCSGGACITPTITPTAGCSPANCPTETPAPPTNTPQPTATSPGCSPNNCTPTPTPNNCGGGACITPTVTPTAVCNTPACATPTP